MAPLQRFSETLPMLLLRARETAMARFRPILNRHGVTEQQWRALRTLRDLGQLTASGLARECSILAPSMTRILRKLVAEGLVTTSRSPDDQRELRVEISARGSALVESVAPYVEREYDLIRAQLNPQRLARLQDDLKQLIEVVGGEEA